MGKVSATLPEDLYIAVKQAAESEKLSINGYLTRMIKQNIPINNVINNENNDTDDNEEVKKTLLAIDSETNAILKKKA